MCLKIFKIFLLCAHQAQNGYNYDRPDAPSLNGGGRPGGFQPSTGAQGGGYPSSATTPTYSAPSFPPNNQAPGSGYNYPAQVENDFPTGPSGTTGYPQRQPTGSGFTGQQTPTGAGQPYPGAQAPTAGASYPGAQAGPGAPYPAAGQSLRPSAPAAAARPTAIGGSTGFGTAQQGPAAGGFGSGIQGGGSSGSSSSSQQDESQEGDYSAIPGEPDVDYPIYSEIPETSFDCSQQEFPGYYADVEARCQVFHICALNKTFDFLCPNGTIFSQENLVCVWWNQFDCNSAESLFANNANLYDNSQTGQQSGQGQVQGQGAVANDFAAPTAGANAPYPAAGRPQTTSPSFGGGSTGPSASYPSGPSSYQPSAPASGSNYPGAAPTGGASYPGSGQTGGSVGYQPSGPSQYPSTQGPYPSAGAAAPPSNVPSSSYGPPQTGSFPTQADTPYPAAGAPQTPNREYLPPRRG